MTYYFETYGCQMNIAESNALEAILQSRGWTAASCPNEATMVVINTCSVRATAENRIQGRLGFYSALKKQRHDFAPLTLVVTGCMAQRLLDTFLLQYPFVDYVVGTFSKSHFATVASNVEHNIAPDIVECDTSYNFAPCSHKKGAFSSFVPIMHGCNNYCSYCIVPYVRGREVSRPLDDILHELDMLSSYKVKEITLLGQNVNSYSYRSIDFVSLLQAISKHLDDTDSSIKWVRFLSSHPKDFTTNLVDTIAALPRICQHIHLPIQHGSNRILKAMNRSYTVEHYLSLVQNIRAKMPKSSLTTDIMVGFPDETIRDVEATLDLMRTVRYDFAYMYYYNPREGTKAVSLDHQVPLEQKKERLQTVIDLQLAITRDIMKGKIGQRQTVLLQSLSRNNTNEVLGKTANESSVVLKAPLAYIGEFVTVKIDAVNGNTFHATLLDC